MCSGIFFVDNIPIKEYKSLINRLSRIEGQIRGIKGMIERDAYCTDILVQSAAVSAAVNAFNKDVIVDNTAQMINISKEITEKMQGYFELMEKTIDDMQINQMQKLLETNYGHAEKNWDIHRLISLNLQDLVSALYLIWKEERKRVRLERRLRL